MTDSVVTTPGPNGGSIASELWALKGTEASASDEFDQATLDSAWVGEKWVASPSAATLDADAVDSYDTGSFTNLRYTLGDRPSWCHFQVPASNVYYLQKTYTFPTNVLIIARMKFNAKASSPANNDGSIGLVVGATTSGFLNRSVSAEMFVNETDTGILQACLNVNGTSSGTPTNSTGRGGSALEYSVIHKIGTTYHHYAGTHSGNFIYLGSNTSSAYDRVGLAFLNANNTAPGTIVTACDFIRFYEGETNFLL